MKFLVNNGLKHQFNPCLGVIYAVGVDNTTEHTHTTIPSADLLKSLKKEFAQYDAIGQHPVISAWRRAYKTFGADPGRYRPSVEALVRRILKDESLPHINPLVDLYNYISVKYILPIGGEDMDAIQGDLQLTFSDGSEQFIRLNGSENEPPEIGEVIYKDDEGVICRRWNWREAERTKLTTQTTNAVIVIDAIPPTQKHEVQQATQELGELIQQYCGGHIKTEIIE